MIGRATWSAMLLILVTSAVTASAQSWEMSGAAGFTPAVALDRRAESLTELNLRGGFTFGVQIARFLKPRWALEVSWIQQASALEVGTGEGTGDLYDIGIARLDANLAYHFGDEQSRWRPFVFGGAGAAIFDARDANAEAKTAFGLGAGVKYFPWAAIGLRAQLRYLPTLLGGDSNDAFCDPFDYCQRLVQPIEMLVGAIVRF
jgi:outer membrane protein W